MRRFDSLPAWLAWLETLHPKAIDMGLERVREVALALDVLNPRVPVVTIAGTNGKGSTSALLEALLQAHGLRAGCYTSPHITRFNERIRIAGQEVPDADIVDALARVDAVRGGISLTYFEFTTLAAFLLFRAAKLDAWVLEIGLGGRLDAVNVIDADVAVLTSVGLDHQEWLGNDRESIGTEKAGIFRAGRPAVIGDADPPVTVLDAVERLSARALRVGSDYTWTAPPAGNAPAQPDWSWQGHDAVGRPVAMPGLPQPPLAVANAATALQAFWLLPFAPEPAAVRRALTTVRLAGRNQALQAGGRTVVVDVGHNADALRFLRAELARCRRGERFHVVLGMLADKDIAAAARVLEPLGVSWHIAPLPTPRSADIASLQAALAGAGARGIVTAYPAIADALRAALASGAEFPVLVTGSFYTVSEAMQLLDNEASR